MKLSPYLIALTLGAGSCLSAQAQELTYNWGAADTVANHTVGPGMKYMKVLYPKVPLILWYVEVDLSNEYAKVEQVQSRHAVPDPLRWDVMTHYKENSRPGHQVRVAWNHDFFSYDASVCIGLNISEGEVTWTRTGRSLLAITDEGKASVFYPTMDTYATTEDGTRVDIEYYNGLTGGLYGDCVLYNRFNSKTLTEQGRYIGLKPLDKWTVNGDPIRCEVTAVGDTPLATTADGQNYVLFLRNGKETALDGHLAVGQTITVTQNFRSTSWGDIPKRILNAFHGYPSIVHDGVLHQGEFNNFENGREYEKSSRVMVGISQDGTKMHVVTTELSAASMGVDCIELSAWLVEKGAWDVVNFDSGGSAAIVIDGDMLNLPGRGSVRPVQDAMLAVSLAPADDAVDHLTFSVPRINPFIISRTPLSVMSFNQYGEVLDDNLQDCEFEVVPSTLGYVDADAIFHASDSERAGTIYARKNGKTAALEVLTHNVSEIQATHTALLTDHAPRLITGLKGVSALGMVDVDPGAFTWHAVPDGIVNVDEEGLMTGVANGKATLTGKFHDIEVAIDVTVELPELRQTLNPMNDLEGLGFTKTSSVKNATLSTTGLPEGWDSGTVMDFDLSTGRSTTVKLSPKLQLYSVPEQLSVRIYDRNGALSQMQYALVDAQGTRINKNLPITEGDHYYTIDFTEDDGSPMALHRYPLTLNTITYYLANKSLPGSQIAFGPLEGYYHGYTPGSGGVADITAPGSLAVSVGAESLTVGFPSAAAATYSVRVYNVAGATVLAETVHAEDTYTRHTLNAKELGRGIYFVELAGPGIRQTAKVVIR